METCVAQGRQTQKPLVVALMTTTSPDEATPSDEATPAGPRTIRLAAIDMGSNSFHLLVVEAHADGHFDTLVSEKEMLGLGEIVANHGFITEEAAELAVDTMRRFVTIARSKQAEEITAYATSAIRDAENSSEVVARISAEVDVRVEVISGQTEARLIFAAMRASITMDATPVIGFDLGGGSVEIMVGDQQSMLWATSVGLGVARLTTLMHDDPPSPSDVKRVRDHLTGVLGPIADRVKPFKPRLAIGSSGTLSDLIRMAEIHHSGRNPPGVNQLTVQRADLLAVHEELIALPLAKRRRLPGLEQRRAALVPAGSLFLTVAMELFGLGELTGCEWALREGMILDAIARHDLVDWTGEDSAIRQTSVLALARRCGWNEAHGRQVARLATDLFDRTASLHGLSSADRELLGHAGLLHDIGEHISVNSHHKHSAYLIEHGRLRGFAPEDIAMLATLVRFHRGSDPKGSFEPFRNLPAPRRDDAECLLALLRLADGLDRGHASIVEEVGVEIDDRKVRLTLSGAGDLDLECWGVRNKRALFERLFARRVEVTSSGHPSLTRLGGA